MNTHQKPTFDALLDAGFERNGSWKPLSRDGEAFIGLDFQCSPSPGVYAFVVDGVPHYIGSAQKGLRTRFRHYGTSKSLQTACRIRAEIIAMMEASKTVEIYTIQVPQIMWNGLPVDLIAGLEEGLIRSIRPVWNRRGNRG